MQTQPAIWQLLQAGPLDGLWSWDVERPTEAWMSARFKQHFGYEDDELPNTAAWWQENILPEDLPRIREQIHRHCAEVCRPCEQIVRYRHKNGSIVWVRCRAFAICKAGSKALRVIGAHTDVTAIKEAQNQFHAGVILESLADSVVIVDRQGIVRFANPAAVKMLTRHGRELVAQPFGFPVNNDQVTELDIIRADGTTGIAEMRVVETIWDGELAHLASLRDITEHKQALARLHQSESTMIAAQRIAHFGSWELDLANPDVNANPLRWSEETFRIFGLEPHAVPVTNELFFSLVHPEDRDPIMQAVTQALREGSEYAIVHRIILPSGEIRYIDEHARVFVDERTGKPYKMVGTVHDITERYAALQELRRAKDTAEDATRAKSQFLAMMSHEIRTPLNPILGAVQLLLDQGGSQEQRELLQLINNAGEHLLTLLNDILDLAKMEAGSIDLVADPVQIPLLVHGVFEIKQEEAHRKKLKLVQQLDKNLAPGYLADLARLRQILLNLVGNAIKFTPSGPIALGVERLAREERHDLLRFSVSDSGIGIAPEQARHIFEPFYQADSSTSRRYEGAGLGLAICQRLVKAMQGEIGVNSQPGQGATFWFNLRLERDRAASAGRSPRSPSSAPFALRRVLLVEDDPRNAIVLRSMLQRLSCEVTLAFDGRGAVKLFQATPFDLVVLDLYLPDMEGSEVARRLREHAASLAISPPPIIAQTASTEAGDFLAIKNSGFEGFLSKPIDLKMLAEMMDRLVPLPAVLTPRRRQTRPGFKFSTGKTTRDK